VPNTFSALAVSGDAFQARIGIWKCCCFLGEGTTGVPGEKPLGEEKRTNNKLNPHMTPGLGTEPGTHWWEASALTTAPSLLPAPCRGNERHCENISCCLRMEHNDPSLGSIPDCLI